MAPPCRGSGVCIAFLGASCSPAAARGVALRSVRSVDHTGVSIGLADLNRIADDCARRRASLSVRQPSHRSTPRWCLLLVLCAEGRGAHASACFAPPGRCARSHPGRVSGRWGTQDEFCPVGPWMRICSLSFGAGLYKRARYGNDACFVRWARRAPRIRSFSIESKPPG